MTGGRGVTVRAVDRWSQVECERKHLPPLTGERRRQADKLLLSPNFGAFRSGRRGADSGFEVWLGGRAEADYKQYGRNRSAWERVIQLEIGAWGSGD